MSIEKRLNQLRDKRCIGCHLNEYELVVSGSAVCLTRRRRRRRRWRIRMPVVVASSNHPALTSTRDVAWPNNIDIVLYRMELLVACTSSSALVTVEMPLELLLLLLLLRHCCQALAGDGLVPGAGAGNGRPGAVERGVSAVGASIDRGDGVLCPARRGDVASLRNSLVLALSGQVAGRCEASGACARS